MTTKFPYSDKTIERAPCTDRIALNNVCIDHGRVDIRMPEELLDDANARTGFQQIVGEAVSECVAGDWLAYIGPFEGLSQPLSNLAEPEWKSNASEEKSIYIVGQYCHKLEIHVGSLFSRLNFPRFNLYES